MTTDEHGAFGNTDVRVSCKSLGEERSVSYEVNPNSVLSIPDAFIILNKVPIGNCVLE